jgi:acyl-CoA synthetase (AMP-forming)/AMP-acid ligase II
MTMPAKKKVDVNIDFSPEEFIQLCKDAAVHQHTVEEHVVFLCEAHLDDDEETPRRTSGKCLRQQCRQQEKSSPENVLRQ